MSKRQPNLVPGSLYFTRVNKWEATVEWRGGDEGYIADEYWDDVALLIEADVLPVKLEVAGHDFWRRTILVRVIGRNEQ